MYYIHNDNSLNNILLNDIIKNLNKPIVYDNKFKTDKLLTYYNKQINKKKIYKNENEKKNAYYASLIIIFIICIIFIILPIIIYMYFKLILS